MLKGYLTPKLLFIYKKCILRNINFHCMDTHRRKKVIQVLDDVNEECFYKINYLFKNARLNFVSKQYLLICLCFRTKIWHGLWEKVWVSFKEDLSILIRRTSSLTAYKRILCMKTLLYPPKHWRVSSQNSKHNLECLFLAHIIWSLCVLSFERELCVSSRCHCVSTVLQKNLWKRGMEWHALLSSSAGLEPDVANTEPRSDAMFPEHSAGLGTLPLPLAACTHLRCIPQKSCSWIHMHDPSKQSQNSEYYSQ